MGVCVWFIYEYVVMCIIYVLLYNVLIDMYMVGWYL